MSPTPKLPIRRVRVPLSRIIFLVALAAWPGAIFAQKDMGAGYCPLHHINYVGADCPRCIAERSGGGSQGYQTSAADQMLIGAAGEFGTVLGTALGEFLRGNPQRAAELQAEAEERARVLQREAAAAERKRQANFARIRKELKLDTFDGDSGGGLLLKGVEVGAGDDHGLKLDDDDLKPRGTRAVANTGPAGAPASHTDTRVVDLRNYRRASFLASFPDVSPEAIIAAAQGDTSIVAMAPPEAVRFASGGDGLRQFQEANDAYHQSHHDGDKAAEYFNRAQAQREIAGRELSRMKADLERQLIAESNPAALTRQHELMGRIFATARAEHEAWVTAKAELDVTRAREAFDRAQLLGMVRGAKSGTIVGVAPEETPGTLPSPQRALRIKSMNALAQDLGWPEADQDRLKTAMETLKLDGESGVASWEISQTWKEMLTRGSSGDLAREAADGDGPGIPGAGTQTAHSDCTVFALANAAGLPYGLVAGRATLLLKEAEWRSSDERAHPQQVLETKNKGLNGDEVIMLAESFGQAKVVTSVNFPQALQSGSPVLVDVSPASGSVTAGHEVVLTKAFLHGGETWYEMMDSNQGPVRRLYLSAKELNLLLIENGVVFSPEPGTVPVLLRSAGTE